MRTIKKSRPHPGPPGFALVMESDLDLRAVIRAALLLDGHRVECVPDCAGVLAWRRSSVDPQPHAFVLALGAGEPDKDWATLQRALDDDVVLSRSAVIVLLTIRIRNGLNGRSYSLRCRSW